MAQEKWEDNMKEVLEKRTLKPSDVSWNVLADRMDAADKQSNRAVFYWVGAAASVVAILFTIAVFFDGNIIKVQQPTLVDTQDQIDGLLLPESKLQQEEHFADRGKDHEPSQALENNIPKSKFPNKPNSLKSSSHENLDVAKSETNKTLEPLDVILQKETLEAIKISETIAQIQGVESNGQTVSDADIDALLLQAQKEINTHSIIGERPLAIDARALLQDVETDLQHSFRNKIFEALKSSYETVRTAVAERNN